MATRNVTMVINRFEAEKYVKGFAVDPSEVADKSYVNMYLHHDGYPEYQGVQTAMWVKHMQDDKGFGGFGDGPSIASHLVKDMHYGSQYLYPSVDSIGHQYTYIIWVGKSDPWISIYNQDTSTCMFVGTPDKLIEKYLNSDMEYTDWKSQHNTKLER